jgi:hypothetical protein
MGKAQKLEGKWEIAKEENLWLEEEEDLVEKDLNKKR